MVAKLMVFKKTIQQGCRWRQMSVDSELKNLRSDTRCCRLRPSMWKHKQHLVIKKTEWTSEGKMKNPEWEREIYRERHNVRVLFQKLQYNGGNNSLTIATTLWARLQSPLYTNWARATALWHIYKIFLNLVCPRDNVNTTIRHLYSTLPRNVHIH